MLAVFTGDGKGKTTSSLGAAARAVGRGQKVLMIQFIKGPWKSGEDFIDIKTSKKSPTRKKGEFKLVKKGLGFVGILGDKLPRKDHVKAAKEALKEARKALKSKKWDFIILDEVNVAVALKLISAKEVLNVVKRTKKEKIILLTGRSAPKSFIQAADLATEMKELKHPFNKGKQGKINLEF